MDRKTLRQWAIVGLGKASGIELRANPFIRDKVIRYERTDEGVANCHTGEVMDTISGRTHYVSTGYQLLVDAIIENELIVPYLSKRASIVYGIVKALAQFNKGSFALRLNHAELRKYYPNFTMSRAAFYRGISELVDRRILLKTGKAGIYWFDVFLFFCGSRSELIDTYNASIKELGPYKPKKEKEKSNESNESNEEDE